MEAVFLSAALTRFEERAHALRSDGNVLLPERLEELWRQLAARYRGPACDPSPGGGRQWALVPHLVHEPFYTYAYAFATLMCLALLAARRQAAALFAARFGVFLRGGGSAGPVEQLRELGVDPLRDDAWQAGLDELERMVRGIDP